MDFTTYYGDQKENRDWAEECKKNGYDYNRRLRHIFWKERSLGIAKRDGYQCRRCEKKNVDLQTHHCYYREYPDGLMAVPWDYPDDSLITLCNDCHRDEEKLSREARAAFIESLGKHCASSKDYLKLAKAFNKIQTGRKIGYVVQVVSTWMSQPHALEYMISIFEKKDSNDKKEKNFGK